MSIGAPGEVLGVGAAAAVAWGSRGGVVLGGSGPVAAAGPALGAEVVADAAVFRASAPVAVLWALATGGLQQLGVLVPALERSLRAGGGELGVGADFTALGPLSQAVGDAAHRVGAGYAVIAAAGSLEGGGGLRDGSALVGVAALSTWRGAALAALQRASGALGDVGERLGVGTARPGAAGSSEVGAREVGAELDGASGFGASLGAQVLSAQVWGAQREVAASLEVLARDRFSGRLADAGPAGRRAGLRWGVSGTLDPAMSTVAALGALLGLVLVGLVFGLWTLEVMAIGVVVGLAGAAIWGWRLVVGARGLRISLRREGDLSGWTIGGVGLG